MVIVDPPHNLMALKVCRLLQNSQSLMAQKAVTHVQLQVYPEYVILYSRQPRVGLVVLKLL